MANSKSEPRSPRYDRRVWWAALAVAVASVLLVAVVASRFVPPSAGMAEHSAGGPSPIGPTCVHYPGAEISITAPAAGTVVVSATVGVGIGHVFGTNDTARIAVAATSTDCVITNYTAFVSVPASLPSSTSYFETVPLLRPFRISSGGSYTMYVTGIMTEGWDLADRFDSASLVAVYHPN